MSGNIFGRIFRIMTWGESHGMALGVVIDGCPAGLELNSIDIQKELEKRRPGQSLATTSRKEPDTVEILSGIFQGKTLGTPISLIIRNKDVDSSKYDEIKDLLRPSHADFTYLKKFGHVDWRGGGRASGRETVGRVAAGAIAKKLLKTLGIEIIGFTREYGGIRAESIDTNEIERNEFWCPDSAQVAKMRERLKKVKDEGDSIGGIVEILVKNIPIGIGEPVFDKLSSNLAKGLLSIGATKGVEFGTGFEAARMTGSEHNDPFIIKDGIVIPASNHAGGMLGGISSGKDLTVRVAVKPIASIAKEQHTVNMKRMEETKIIIEGRHDPSAIPRIIPVCEAMTALVVVDLLLLALSSRVENLKKLGFG
ncbi:MAG: chorismate synthase [Candidatus Helarchaeota archaeon]